MTRLAYLRQLHQQRVGEQWQELYDALPHLLDIAEAAKASLNESTDEEGNNWVAFHPAAVLDVREALNRLEQP